ncbi:MAG: hypothetical protein K9J16_12250 [Melioribacteraceae bacterium]|nr:hypothetical protein [Melioribacteraceae bacterium]MCF8354599.1 hypothetical protein [Melioribacteraceae bacterium]MCF8394951.1 hypothetical protein [Melioribacteraceae bacterium]MCF8420176.1 hypothetical protein [Melioribacteraceae bacterium]
MSTGFLFNQFMIFFCLILFVSCSQKKNNSQIEKSTHFNIDSTYIKEFSHDSIYTKDQLILSRLNFNNNRSLFEYDALKSKRLIEYLVSCKFETHYGKIIYDEFTGELINDSSFKKIITIREYFENESQYILLKIAKGYLNDQNKRAHLLFNRYGWEKEKCMRITRGETWIGMTSEMCKASIGEPDKINKSTYAFGTYEQWIYSSEGIHLYFENGVLLNKLE